MAPGLIADSFDWNRIVPFVLLGIVWLVALYNLIQGLRTGRMRAFRRNEGSDEMDTRPAMYCTRSESPKSFWALFAFYAIVLLLVPVMLFAVYQHEQTEPAINPGGDAEIEGE